MLLTGASRGIGHATVRLFHENGWRIITVARSPFSSDCPWMGGPDQHIEADLSDPDCYGRVADEVRRRLPQGRLSAIVNNAGVSPKLDGGARMGISQTHYADWLDTFNINLFAAAELSRHLLPELKAARGSIVNITSIASARVHPFAGAVYACSKAALAALTREQASEFAALGIRANALSPGEIDTAILSPGTEKIVETQVPMNRLGEPGEVAEAVLFLCSERSSYINGAEIQINGGQHV
ncbi:SDR family oxidoreductase [Rugamonas sp. FT81W]|uniref:SDR family oxidoreductase n=2 Tax=Duganella vulcania TaxID=2692166 RepID=A0A845GTT3_9BURK|nr:SDR family oxidoreductase [Duganella vulcania]